MYDLKDPAKVWTHARAFSKIRNIGFAVADADTKQAKKIAGVYKTRAVNIAADTDFSPYDIVSITTPTPTHYAYLEQLLRQNIPLVICEKPVAASIKELNELTRLYKRSETKVLVNYIRRFQPAYEQLKKRLAANGLAGCTGINIKYQRGLLNNGGHAFDLLEFLYGQPFLFSNFKLQKAVFDAFEYDPTVSGSCRFAGCPVTILGIENAGYPVFEIELFFPGEKIVICHSGDEIRYYAPGKKNKALVENKKKRQVNILSQYMLPVVKQGITLLHTPGRTDNFLQALELNKRITRIISSIRK